MFIERMVKISTLFNKRRAGFIVNHFIELKEKCPIHCYCSNKYIYNIRTLDLFCDLSLQTGCTI